MNTKECQKQVVVKLCELSLANRKRDNKAITVCHTQGKCKNQIYNGDSYKEPLNHLRRTFKVSLQYNRKDGFLTS